MGGAQRRRISREKSEGLILVELCVLTRSKILFTFFLRHHEIFSIKKKSICLALLLTEQAAGLPCGRGKAKTILRQEKDFALPQLFLFLDLVSAAQEGVEGIRGGFLRGAGL